MISVLLDIKTIWVGEVVLYILILISVNTYTNKLLIPGRGNWSDEIDFGEFDNSSYLNSEAFLSFNAPLGLKQEIPSPQTPSSKIKSPQGHNIGSPDNGHNKNDQQDQSIPINPSPQNKRYDGDTEKNGGAAGAFQQLLPSSAAAEITSGKFCICIGEFHIKILTKDFPSLLCQFKTVHGQFQNHQQRVICQRMTSSEFLFSLFFIKFFAYMKSLSFMKEYAYELL